MGKPLRSDMAMNVRFLRLTDQVDVVVGGELDDSSTASISSIQRKEALQAGVN